MAAKFHYGLARPGRAPCLVEVDGRHFHRRVWEHPPPDPKAHPTTHTNKPETRTMRLWVWRCRLVPMNGHGNTGILGLATGRGHP